MEIKRILIIFEENNAHKHSACTLHCIDYGLTTEFSADPTASDYVCCKPEEMSGWSKLKEAEDSKLFANKSKYHIKRIQKKRQRPINNQENE